jgi:hypothetical protein
MTALLRIPAISVVSARMKSAGVPQKSISREYSRNKSESG